MVYTAKDRTYSNILFLNYFRYLEREFGKEIRDQVIAEAGLDLAEVSDPEGFQSVECINQMRNAAIRLTGLSDLPYRTGRAFHKNLGKSVTFLLGGTTPQYTLKKIAEVEGRMIKPLRLKSEFLNRTTCRIDVKFADGFVEHPDSCRNRHGIYESLPLVFGLPTAWVEHPLCKHRGDAFCQFIIHMPDFKFGWLRVLGVSLSFFGLLSGLLLLTPLIPFIVGKDLAVGFLGLGAISFALHGNLLARKSQDWMNTVSDGVLGKNEELERNHNQIVSMRDLSIQLNQVHTESEISNIVTRSLVERFQFGSSMLWLVGADGMTLTCASATGYPDSLLAFITNTHFRLDQGRDNPYGLLIQTFDKRETLLVNDVPQLLPKLTGRTASFITELNPSAFIITPLFDEGRPIGLLTGEQHGGKQLTERERAFFISISGTVATAVIKSRLISGLEETISERTAELETTSAQLMQAKEMAIQAEKLSSLGQMAAGVAHEINNPLNFLVNILPDLEKDIDALASIRKLAEESGNATLKEAIQQVNKAADLDSHLEEKDFVFSRIRKSLNKTTQIANSLKVFSRSSAKEEIKLERACDMVQDVIDLIPQTNRGDTEITVEIPESITINCNKNEMEQAFLVLVNNAIDAMKKKGELTITGKVIPHQGYELRFADNGPGIPAAILKKIFDPFFTTKDPGKGTGLGLTIATEIVRKYGGALAVESKGGEGATFILVFKPTPVKPG